MATVVGQGEQIRVALPVQLARLHGVVRGPVQAPGHRVNGQVPGRGLGDELVVEIQQVGAEDLYR